MTFKRTSMAMWMLAAALATAMPAWADAVSLPASAVTDDTTLVIWFDAEHFTPEAIRQAVDRINAALPEQVRATAEQLEAQLDEGMREFGAGYEAFTGAGGEGLLMLVRAPEPGTPPTDPAMLVRVAPGTTAEQLTEAMREFAPDEEEDPELATYAEGWLVPVEARENVPTDGTAENAQAFEQLLANTSAAPIRMGFRMNPSMREQIAALEQQQAQQQAQGPMGGNPATALLTPAKDIDGGWATVQLGEDPAFRPVIHLSNEQSAEQLRAAWEQLLFMGQQMFMMQFANVPEAPAPESIEGLFQSLQLQRDGQNLSAEIGSEFITRVGEIAPAIEPLLMQMFMGGMGQQQQAPPMAPPMQ